MTQNFYESFVKNREFANLVGPVVHGVGLVLVGPVVHGVELVLSERGTVREIINII